LKKGLNMKTEIMNHSCSPLFYLRLTLYIETLKKSSPYCLKKYFQWKSNCRNLFNTYFFILFPGEKTFPEQISGSILSAPCSIKLKLLPVLPLLVSILI